MISLEQMAASAALGAFIGYFTNSVAIKSLFRPLRPRWYSLGWQGVIPRNRDRLADNISQVVGRDLLYPDYLIERLREPRLQENLRAYIRGHLEKMMKSSLSDFFSRLPEGWRERGVEEGVRRGLEILSEWSESASGLDVKNRVLDLLEERLRGLEVETLLDPRKAETLVEELGKRLTDDQARIRLTGLLREQLESCLDAETPLEEIVPDELRELMHSRLREEVPIVMRRLAVWLAAPENVEYMSRRILAALESYAGQESWLARLLGEIGLRLFGEQIRSAIMARIPQVAYEYLHSPQIRRKIEEQLIGSIDHLLRRPLREVVGRHRKILVERISFIAAAWMTSPEVRDRAGRFLLREYQRRARRSLGDLLPDAFWEEARPCLLEVMSLSRERAASWSRPLGEWLCGWMRQSRTELRQWLGLSREGEEALVSFLRERATGLLCAEIPPLLEQLDITRMVRDKIVGFDLLKVERMIKSIISDQLRHINLLGALLGGLVGLILPFLNAFLERMR